MVEGESVKIKEGMVFNVTATGKSYINLVDDALLGVLRVTTSTSSRRDHVSARKRIPYSAGDANNEYSRNIQIADLNALNAALAVIKWKKLRGFYLDADAAGRKAEGLRRKKQFCRS